MKRLILVGMVVGLLLSGCATIIKGSGPQAIQLKSNPQGASCEVYNLRTNEKLETGRIAPATLMLSSGKSYFEYAKYRIRCDYEGKSQEALVEGSVNGWYIGGNIIFGGLIGSLIVDPITGAMWTLEPDVINADFEDPSKSILKKEVVVEKPKETLL